MAATNLWSSHSEKHFWFFWTFFLHHWTTVMPFWFWLKPKSITHKFQRVLNAAAHIVSDARKCDRGLFHLLRDELHWLNFPRRVQFKLCASVHRCLQSRASQYMTECCIPLSDITCRQHLRSAVLPPAVRTSLPAFDVWSSDLLCGWHDGLELVT